MKSKIEIGDNIQQYFRIRGKKSNKWEKKSVNGSKHVFISVFRQNELDIMFEFIR